MVKPCPASTVRRKTRGPVLHRRWCLCATLLCLPLVLLVGSLPVICRPTALMSLLSADRHHPLLRGGLDSFQALRILPDSCYLRPNPALLTDPGLMRNTAVQHGSMSDLCSILNATEVHTVAIVGNGPLTSEQRDRIQRADRIVRFNGLNNRLPGEPTDVWIVRYSANPPSMFWGLDTLQNGELWEVVAHSRMVLFLGGSDAPRAMPVELLLHRKLPTGTGSAKLLQIGFDMYRKVYNSVLSDSLTLAQPEAEPSSGILGLLTVLGCVKPDAHLEVFGFNWSSKSFHMHSMADEQALFKRLQRQYPHIQLHSTACEGGLYSCVDTCDNPKYRVVEHGRDAAECQGKVRRPYPVAQQQHAIIEGSVSDSLA